MKLFLVGSLLCSVLLPLGTAEARTWYITPDGTGDAPTIQAGVDSAAAGDSVILQCGTYNEFNIQLKSAMYLGSFSGLPECVTINAHGQGTIIKCRDVDNSTTVAGLTMTRGHAPWVQDGSGGGGMSMKSSSPAIVNCTFLDNYADDCGGDPAGGIVGGGLYCSYLSAPTLVNCSFIKNTACGSGGGIFTVGSWPTLSGCTFSENSSSDGGAIFSIEFSYSPPSFLTLDHCVFSRNWASTGILTSYQSAFSVASCTFVGNWGGVASGIRAGGGEQRTISNSIFAFNQGLGWAIFGGSAPSNLTLTCCDIFGNEGGDWTSNIADQLGKSGNISIDPQFCDFGGADYTLKQCSPCAPNNHPDEWNCGLIGALPVGCPGTAVEETTWGRIKSMFR